MRKTRTKQNGCNDCNEEHVEDDHDCDDEEEE